MYNVFFWGGGGGVRFAEFISFFLNIPIKIKEYGLTETKLFHFHIIFKNGCGEGVGGGGGRGVQVKHFDLLNPPSFPIVNLEQLENMWDMQFNPSKCQILQITKRQNPLTLSTLYIM